MKLFKICLPVLIAGSGLLMSSKALATAPEVAHRCGEDSLDPVQAEQRVKWAIKCAKANGGSFFNYGVNKYVSLMFEAVYDDNFNVVANNKRARPLYPIFTDSGLTKTWTGAPKSESASCDVPAGYVINVFCTSSCYRPDQKLAFVDGEEEIKTAFDGLFEEIMVVDKNSTRDDIGYEVEQINNFTRSIKDIDHTLYHFQTVADRELVVTENHPLVDSTGKMRRADSLKVGESLVLASGEPAEITSVETSQFFGKVYNVQPVLRVDDELGGVNMAGQIVVAEGYLSGSDWFQNGGEDNINRMVLRNQIPNEML